MKSKNKKEIAKENKKPPQLNQNENEKKEEEPKIENKEITEEVEKKMLEGQEHVEDINEIPQEQPKELEQNEPPKKQMLIKPRETYLQEKISKMNPNKNLMSNIKKELGEKVKTVIKDENVVINEVTKDLNKYIKKDSDSTGKNANENYLNKQKYKEVKKLNDELNILKKNLLQLEENEKLLQDEGFIQLNNSKNNSSQNTMFDKSIKEQQLKLILEKKSKLTAKIKGIEYQIKDIIEDHKTLTNKEKVKIYIDNFERDKEIAEIRAKKFLKESKELDKKMKDHMKQFIEKRIQKLEEIEKEEKKKKDEKFLEAKNKSKAFEEKQSKLSEEIFIKYKPYINQKPEKTKKDYLYNKRYDSFIKKEEKLFKDETNKNRKEKEKISYKFEDIDKFATEFDEKLENRKYEQEQKSMQLSEQWSKNRGKLPKCNYQIPEKEEKETKKVYVSDDDNDNEGNAKETPFTKYGKKVRRDFMPEIDEKKREEREKIIFSLEDPKKAGLKSKAHSLKNQKKKRILLKKRDKSKPSKYEWLKLEEPEKDKVEALLQNLIHKPKKINLQPITRITTEAPEKKPDYLKEMINKREEKNRVMSPKDKDNANNEIIKKNEKKWEKAVNNKSGTLIQNINYVQGQAEKIDKEADQKEKMLECKGGIENNPELGRKVSNLLIDSIQAKINILKKMNEV